MTIEVVPITYRQACAFIDEHHRHHRPPQGHKFSIGLERDNELVGVVCVGRPVARKLDDGRTAEVTRLCLIDGVPNGCSTLYAAAARASKAMGYRMIVTYTLASEGGTSLRASGWSEDRTTAGGEWSRPSRGRRAVDQAEAKTRWVRSLA